MRSGTGHYSLAFTCECIAASRFHPIDYRSYGWIRDEASDWVPVWKWKF